MKIWLIESDDKAIQFTLKYEDDGEKIILPHGECVKENWNPIQLITLRKGTRRDFTTFFTGLLAFVGKTKSILDPLIHDCAEYLPVIHDELDVTLVHVINLLDCADKQRSIARTVSGGIFYKYAKVYFREDILVMNPAKSAIFMLPEDEYSIFVNDEFRNLVLKHRLKGLQFIEAWDSEFTEEMEQEQQARYQAILDSIENAKGPRLTFDEAVRLVEAGGAVAHKQWKMQLNKKGVHVIGTLKEDCTYQWIDPVYIPPIFLESEWVEVEKSDI